MSVWWTSELDARLRALWPDRNNTLAKICAELGKSVSDASRRAQKLGLVPRQSGRVPSYMAQEAVRRGVTLPVLKQNILAAVARDKLVGAVLDDEDERMAAA